MKMLITYKRHKNSYKFFYKCGMQNHKVYGVLSYRKDNNEYFFFNKNAVFLSFFSSNVEISNRISSLLEFSTIRLKF